MLQLYSAKQIFTNKIDHNMVSHL